MQSKPELRLASALSLLTLLLGFNCLARAQDPQPAIDASKPKPAAQGMPGVIDPDDRATTDNDPFALSQPDSRPLTGVQSLSLGSPEVGHSYLVPGIQFLDTARSISLNEATGSNWSSTTFLAGSLSLYRLTSHSELSANYLGGGFFSSDGAQGNGFLHELGLTQSFKWRRWHLSLIDEFSYLPESSFGFGLGTGISTPGIGGGLAPALPSLQNSYQPNQSILTSNGARYSNSFATEVVYEFRRSSINVAGTYAILRFVEPGNIESDADILTVGYNYQISSQNSMGVLYRLTEYHFLGSPQGLADHAAHIAFGRKITGRLALQLFAGPELALFRQPIDNETQSLRPSGGVTLTYRVTKGDVLLSYNHGVSNGGGVLIGADTDQLRLELDREISRRWQASFFFGFARNRGLGSFVSVNQSNQNFNSYVAGGALSHPLGHDAALSLAYSARIQNSTQSVCAAGNCATSFTQHQLSFGMSWHARPLVLR
jgi:hypothetical protein